MKFEVLDLGDFKAGGNNKFIFDFSDQSQDVDKELERQNSRND